MLQLNSLGENHIFNAFILFFFFFWPYITFWSVRTRILPILQRLIETVFGIFLCWLNKLDLFKCSPHLFGTINFHNRPVKSVIIVISFVYKSLKPSSICSENKTNILSTGSVDLSTTPSVNVYKLNWFWTEGISHPTDQRRFSFFCREFFAKHVRSWAHPVYGRRFDRTAIGEFRECLQMGWKGEDGREISYSRRLLSKRIMWYNAEPK